ncbi:G-patch domain-containing protein [Mycena kentingensis (nom. inval.)]|nr:G-patch domain-containing protein [Mycena kentingensis (nom. inval.)]
MGLSGRKNKQRIGNDPRNLAWADDAAKFGATYLSKFGWDASKGLGAEGEGRLSHIKVSQKLDMLGIGAAQQKDPNGIAWKQNRDFERVLERLNAATGVDGELKGEELEKTRPLLGDFVSASAAAAVDAVKPVVPRHRAHRARAIAAKNIASKSSAAISEILGIKSTESPATATPTTEGALTPYTEDGPELMTTSTKSVADYFKDKLLAKANKFTAVKVEESDEKPRGGIGSIRRDDDVPSRFGLGSLRLKTEEDDGAPRMGLGSSKFASMFASATASTSIEDVVVKQEEDSEDAKAEKKRRKKERRDRERATEGESEAKKKKVRKGKSREIPAELSEEEEKQKKSKRRHEEDGEEEEDSESKPEKKKKRRRKEVDGEEETEDARAERKRAKKEKKRLKSSE